MPYFARIGDRAHRVESLAQVSDAYTATIELLGLGATNTPPCRITDEDGVTVAHVSYNGRIWLGADHTIAGAFPIFDPH